MSKHEPGTGTLQFLVQEERETVHACNDCVHVSNASEAFARCAAFGGRYAADLRGQMLAKGQWRCPGYRAERPAAPSAQRAKRGWLYRLLAWIWVVP
jgi:hypothetical protein